MKKIIRVVILTVLATAIVGAQTRPMVLGGRSLLHAHNAYPEEGQWGDRIDRALATGQTPIVIEQDVTYATGANRGVIVSHDTELDGSEPTLQSYFFDRVRPLIESALAKGDASRWPVIVLHLDFKTNDTAHHRAVWDLLKRHEAWLTTARADRARVSAFKPGPLLVLTENGADQEKDFSGWADERGSHLIFGSIPAPTIVPSTDDPAERARLIRNAPPTALVPASATSYRRWVNFAWMAVEEGGPAKAAAWNARDERRLTSIVNYAHAQGLLVRFYTLNGHDDAVGRGWTASYNFGSLDAVRLRWRAAIKAGVDLIATDQYEELAAVLGTRQ